MILLWFDSEFTTQDIEKASFMQIALAATDIDLNPINLQPFPDQIPQKYNRTMGKISGLSLPVKLPVTITISDYVNNCSFAKIR